VEGRTYTDHTGGLVHPVTAWPGFPD
jgi:hypothetical protein